MTVLRVVLAVVVATASGFFIHVHYGRGLAVAYVQAQAAAGRLSEIVREPYPTPVFLTALATALIPMAFKVGLFMLVREQLPGRSGAAKGVWYGLLLLAVGDNFIRMPIMSVVVGNPVDVMLVQSAEAWVINLVTGLLIGTMVPADAGQRLLRRRAV